MEHSIKKVWRVISPIVIYLVIERIVGFIINFVYILNQVDATVEWTDELKNQLTLQLYEMQTENAVVISGIVALICILIFYRVVRKEWLKRSYRIVINDASHLRYLYVGMLSAGFTLSVNLIINAWGLFKYNWDFAKVSQMIYSESLLIQILVIGIIVPICEELIFRGVVYERILQTGTMKSAMLISSILFAFFHGSWLQIVYAFAFSFLIIYAYQRCGNFRVTICFHILSNLSALVLRQLPPLPILGYSIGIVAFGLLGFLGLYMLRTHDFYEEMHI